MVLTLTSQRFIVKFGMDDDDLCQISLQKSDVGYLCTFREISHNEPTNQQTRMMIISPAWRN